MKPEVLYNRIKSSDGDNILAVMVGTNGKLILPGIFPAIDTISTVQITKEEAYIYTKDTYTGDDPSVLEFFNRSEDDPLYGYLITPENKDTVTTTVNLIDAMKPYDICECEVVIGSNHIVSIMIDHLLKKCLNLSKEEIETIVKDEFQKFDKSKLIRYEKGAIVIPSCSYIELPANGQYRTRKLYWVHLPEGWSVLSVNTENNIRLGFCREIDSKYHSTASNIKVILPEDTIEYYEIDLI